MKKWLFFSFFSLLLTSGCAGTDETNSTRSYDLRTDKSAPQYMSNRSVGRDQPHLVEQDITNQNPNFLDLDGTGNGTERGSNIGIDTDKARETVARTKKFTPGRVNINGSRMWVTAYKKGIQTNNERTRDEAYLHRKLIAALPRYEIEVRVLEDRR